MGFASSFTAFLVLLGGICLGIMLFVIECISKHTKLDIPLLDIYDRKDNIELDELDPNNWNNILMKKNDTIHHQEIHIKLLKKKIYTLTKHKIEQSSQKPWYRKFTNAGNADNQDGVTINDITHLVRGEGLGKNDII